jgi:ubiquinone/menaquinone biosynthesis C-methylase UbiE
LFDAVLCSENNLKDIQSLLKEMYRVLKMGGVYLMISHGPPDNRVNHIKRYIDVDIDVVPIRKSAFLVVCRLVCIPAASLGCMVSIC